MIDQSTNLKEEILLLLRRSSFYYTKAPNIVEKISFNGRKFYSKYLLVQKNPDEELIKKYLNGNVKVAIPLKNGEVFIRFYGKEWRRFFYLLNKLLKEFQIELFLFFMDENKRLNIFFKTKEKEAEVVKYLSVKLEELMEREWKILPNETLPKNYNIFPLPSKEVFESQN
jgi:hypothetical protein